MLKFILGILLLILFTNTLHSEENLSTWDQGALTWDDFQAKTGELGKAYLYYELTCFPENGDTTAYKFLCKATIKPEKSWVDSNMMTLYNLDYFQGIFRRLEIERILLQKEMDNCTNLDEANQVLDKNRHLLSERSSTLCSQTELDSNSNSDCIEIIHTSIQDEIEKMKRNGQVEVYSNKFQFGYNFMMGSSILTQQLDEQFTTPISYLLGLEFHYDKSFFCFEMLGAEGKANDITQTDSRWEKGETAVMTLFGFSYAYDLIESRRFVFYQFVGIGYAELNNRKYNDGAFEIDRGRYKPFLGFGFDYKLKSGDIILPSFFHFASDVQFRIKFKFYVHRPQYYDNINGLSYNFVIGIGGLLQVL